MTANRYENDQPTRLALLEQSISNLKESLERIERNINKGFSDVNKRIDDLSSDANSTFIEVNNRLWRNFYFLIGGFAGLFAMMGHGFKWF